MPAAHGGFETFAEHLALYLCGQGWRVTVYCQSSEHGAWSEDVWQGVHRVHIPVGGDGPKHSVVFDWHATRHAARTPGLCLTLGYNTAVFCALLRLAGRPNVINMDGIEWQRAKWGRLTRVWFWANEHAGSWLANRLIADHPEIKSHLSRATREDKITVIPYGAHPPNDIDDDCVRALGLVPGHYLTLVARPEPENSVLEVVRGYSRRQRGKVLAVLGSYDGTHAYHRAVRAAAGDEVRFLGAIYDRRTVQALRRYSVAYVHGHRVGGTNPSLVEALAAGNPVIAHDNRFNRWVAGDAARYFSDENDFAAVADAFLNDAAALRQAGQAAVARFEQAFTWPMVLQAYETLLLGMQDGS